MCPWPPHVAPFYITNLYLLFHLVHVTRPEGQTGLYLCRLHPSWDVEKSSSGGKREKRSGIQDQMMRIS